VTANTDHNFTPLDPTEGPTVWAKQDESNPNTYIIAEGTNPLAPQSRYQLSVGEIRRLSSLVEMNENTNDD